MQLSIITINRNDAKGLKMTLESVMNQIGVEDLEIEHIIVDGASTDESVDVIRRIGGEAERRKGGEAEGLKGEGVYANGIHYRWISEPDKGIYNAMNKGIRMATGEYIEILNSADMLAAPDVCVRMLTHLQRLKGGKAEGRRGGEAERQRGREVEILYGNMIKQWPDGRTYCDRCEGGGLTMLSFYHGTLNHDPAYIRKSLFDKFGYYDESLKIVSDWAWYLRAIPLGGVEPIYVNIDVTIFDMTGVSESNTKLWPIERRPILEREVPRMILADYDKYASDMRMMDRIRKHHMYKLVYFIERVLFKLEKWHVLR